jgi:hypothetical protein
MRSKLALLTALVAAATPLVSPATASPSARPALADRTFTVVAVPDSGINPYHTDFRRPELTAHPSTYIEGFPRKTPALELAFGSNYGMNLTRDRDDWGGVETGELVWIPGTNIIGAVDVTGGEYAFLDDLGHGTAVASIAGGRSSGPGADDVLIVAIKGTTSDTEAVAPGAAAASRRAVADGKVVCFASGNRGVPLWHEGEQGPSWNLNVGAASSSNRGEHFYSGWPNDVLGIANVSGAAHDSVSGTVDFSGTSAATPNVCGQVARTLARVRAEVGDVVQGPHRKSLATGKGRGAYLDDGRLTNYELIDAIQATAVPAEPNPPHPDDPSSFPALPVAPWVRGGYGIVDGDSAAAALDVLLGREDRPDRSMEDAWIEALDGLRNALWGDPP